MAKVFEIKVDADGLLEAIDNRSIYVDSEYKTRIENLHGIHKISTLEEYFNLYEECCEVSDDVDVWNYGKLFKLN